MSNSVKEKISVRFENKRHYNVEVIQNCFHPISGAALFIGKCNNSHVVALHSNNSADGWGGSFITESEYQEISEMINNNCEYQEIRDFAKYI